MRKDREHPRNKTCKESAKKLEKGIEEFMKDQGNTVRAKGGRSYRATILW